MKQQLFSVCLLACFTYATYAEDPAGFEKKNGSVLRFTENKGQVMDQNRQPRPDVLYSGNANGMVYHLRNNGISYQLNRTDSRKSVGGRYKHLQVADRMTIYRLDVNWLNCNPQAQIQTGQASVSRNNYYLRPNEDGILDVKSYSSLIYKELYAGIDLKWYEQNGQLKYDYLVSAGADYTQIRLELKGAEKIWLNAEGELVVRTPLGEIAEQAPVVIQNNKRLKASWQVTGNVASFNISGVNASQPFVIDPLVRIWGTYIGGTNGEYALQPYIDAVGDVFVVGFTGSNSNIATSGSHQSSILAANGAQNGFVQKYSSTGTLLWGTYYGQAGDNLFSCVVDATGNVYAAGTCYWSGFASSSNVHQPFFNGNADGILIKFNSSGVRVWATYFGGAGYDDGQFCTIDPSGNIWMCGSTSSSNAITNNPSTHQFTYGGGTDAYLARFSSTGGGTWFTYYGGSDSDVAYGCSADASGNIFMSGGTLSSSGIASSGAHQTNFGGGSGTDDGFLVKFNSSGVRQWGTYYGGSGSEYQSACAADASGNVYITGGSNTSGGTAIATSGSHQSANGGSFDAYLAKFDGSGVRQWGTYYGGTGGSDAGYFCTVDAGGNPYMVGYAGTGSDLAMSTSGEYKTTITGSADAFVAKFNTNGVRQWSSFYGESNFDAGYGLSIGSNGAIYLAGYTGVSPTGTAIATTGANQTMPGGIYDGFVVKLQECITPAAPTNTTPAANQSVCSGATTTLAASSTGSVTWYATATTTTSLGNGSTYPVPSSLSVGSYTYYAAGSNSCGASVSRTGVTFTVHANPMVSASSPTTCAGSSVVITPSGASTYTISGNTFTVSPTVTTTYSITGTSGAGCVSGNTAQVAVTVFSLPVVSAPNGSICTGQSFSIVPSGAGSYSVNGNTNLTVNPSSTAVFSLTGKNTAGCTSTAALVTVNVYSLPVISVNSGSLCLGQTYTLAPTGASTYTFSSGSATVSPIITSTYTVTGTSASGCVSAAAATATVTLIQSPVVSVNSGSVCPGAVFTITPSGAFTYSVTGSSFTVSPSVSTSYTVTGTNPNGCANIVVSSVTVEAAPNVGIGSSVGSTLCLGQSAVLTATGAVNYTWGAGQFTTQISVSPAATTVYSVTGVAANGCSNTYTFMQNVVDCSTGFATQFDGSAPALMGIYPNPNSGEFTVQLGSLSHDMQIQLFNAQGQKVYEWMPQSTLNTITVKDLANGVYLIRVAGNGSSSRAVKLVKKD